MNRLERAKQMLSQKGLDAIVVSDPHSMHYLSAAEYEGYFLLTNETCYVMTDSRYTDVCERDTKGATVVTLKRGQTYVALLQELAKRHNLVTFGFEDRHLTVSSHEKFTLIDGLTFSPIGGALEELRYIKDADELDYLREAEHIGDKAFDHILGILRPGMTEIEVALALEAEMRRCGAQGLSFDTIVASGVNGSMPHSVPSTKKLVEGELITMDFGCRYHGYCSDMTRTVALGNVDAKLKEIYDVVYEAQLVGLDALRAGVSGAAVDAASREIIERAGYGENFGHGLGHSVGLFIHEDPRLSPAEERLLLPDMVVTVEPGIYLTGIGGVRIEDMVRVTKEGHENFAKSPKQLITV